MRGGLNLTRLARSSEGKHFKEVQALQTSELRGKLSKEELAVAAEKAGRAAASAPTVDTVATIAGHSAYSKLAAASHDAVTKAPEPFLLRRLQNPSQSHLASSQLQAGNVSVGPDPAVLRVLSQNRMAILARAQAEIRPARPLPGSETKAAGAVLGMQAFISATAAVASVGLAGVLYLYFNPKTVESMKHRSIRFRDGIENGTIGIYLRQIADGFRKGGGLLSNEASSKASIFARKATGVKTVEIAGGRGPASELQDDSPA